MTLPPIQPEQFGPMGDVVEFPPKPFTREEALAVLVYQNPVSPRAVMALKPAQLERQIDKTIKRSATDRAWNEQYRRWLEL